MQHKHTAPSPVPAMAKPEGDTPGPAPVDLGGSINLDRTDVGGPGQRGPRRTMVQSDG